MDIDQGKRVTLFTGNFGSGKTEVAVNYSRALADQQKTVRLVDLDIVNPYFRSREATDALDPQWIEVISPKEENFWADLPIILPEIRGIIQRSDHRAVLDVGGDDVGARVLSSFADLFKKDEYMVLMVLNKNRPFTDTPEGCVKMIKDIKQASRLTVGGLVSNTHLMEETTVDMILDGVKMAKEVSGKTGIPLVMVSVEKKFLRALKNHKLKYPVLPMERIMLPPWLEAGKKMGIS